jgi:hypothetical protein
MPRTIDPRLARVMDRANPLSRYMVDLVRPDARQVLRRASDQFLQAPPQVSVSPANSLAPDPTGGVTLASSASTLASFAHEDDFTTTHIDAAGLSAGQVRGLCWTVDPSCVPSVIRSISVRLSRDKGTTQNVGLMIYRRDSAPGVISTFVPLLDAPVVWVNPIVAGGPFTATFDLIDRNLRLPQASTSSAPGTPIEYYLVLSVENGDNRSFWWARDRTASHTVAGIGTFSDRQWTRSTNQSWEVDWSEDHSLPSAVPCATIVVEHYSATSAAVYSVDLGRVPSAGSKGRVVFERSAPAGTATTLELSTAGSGGPWTPVVHADPIAVAQQLYHLRLTLNANTAGNTAPRVSAIGVEFRVPIDVSAEAIVSPLPQDVDVPFLAAGIGEGSVTVLRTGKRDFRDAASEVASSSAPITQVEAEIRIGSTHPAAPEASWLMLDRATVNNRAPSIGSEDFGLLSGLRRLKVKLPPSRETFSTTHAVVSSLTASGITSVVVTPALPDATASDVYANQHHYVRVASSTQPGISTGYVREIDSNTGTNSLLFGNGGLPSDFIAGDVLEVHSAQFVQDPLVWHDADLADIWWDLLTLYASAAAIWVVRSRWTAAARHRSRAGRRRDAGEAARHVRSTKRRARPS